MAWQIHPTAATAAEIHEYEQTVRLSGPQSLKLQPACHFAVNQPEDDELARANLGQLVRIQKESRVAQAAKVARPITLTDDTFWGIVGKAPLALVDFGAAWCAPCRVIEPYIEAIAHDYGGRLIVGRLNTDENPRIAAAFGIKAIPTLIVFRNGKLADVIIGAVSRPVLDDLVRRWL